MRYQLDPLSPNGVSKEAPKPTFQPYFAGGPGKPSLLDSVNGKHGAVQITGGSNVTVDSSGNDIVISSSGGGEVGDNLILPGWLHVGSESDPANTTAGDITGERLAIGDDTAFSTASGSFAKFKGEMTDTSGGAKYGVYSQADINNASASTSEIRVLGMSAQIKSGNTQNIGTLIGIFGETRVFGNSTTSSLFGGRFFGTVVPSTSELSGKTLSNVYALDVTGFKISGTPPNAATITTVKGLNINNNDAPSPLTITSSIGIDISAQTRGATNNFGIRVAAPSGATNNFAIQLSDTGGTAAGGLTFGTDVQLYRSAANVLKLNDSFTLVGNLQVDDALTATKGYRFRTTGSNLDTEGSAVDWYWSVFASAGFTGTQHTFMIASASGAQLDLPLGFKTAKNGSVGGLIHGATRQTASYTVVDGITTVFIDATGGNRTITIPSAWTSGNLGRVVRVRRIDNSANTVTIDTAGGDIQQRTTGTVTSTITVAAYDKVELEANGNGMWYVM